MNRNYILTHTPRQIAADNSMDEINFWANSVSSDFDGSNGGDIFGLVSPADGADEIASLETCEYLISQWYEDTPIDERPDAEELQFAYQILCAQYLKRCEEWE